MSRPSDHTWEELRRRVLGLGEGSSRKSYYPSLRQQLVQAERFRAAVDLSSDLLFVIDLETDSVLDVNEMACQHLGKERESLTGMPVNSVFDVATSASLVQLFSDFRKSVRDRDTLVAELVAASGDVFPVEIAVRCGGAGANAYAVLAARDISERLRAEREILQLNAELEERVRIRTAELEASNRELEAFAYSVSHDLRTPLRGIDGWSLAVLEDYGDRLDDVARRYLSRVRAEAQRIGALIDGLLWLSRISRAPAQFRRVDLSALAQRIAVGLREMNPDREIEFAINPGLTALGDETLLEVALTNLMGNAVKFTGPRPQALVEVGAGRSGAETVFYVRDNGVGFDMSHAGILFKPFQRLHRTSQFPGDGIGLATVQRVVQRHGGRIWAEAEPDRGATFYFTLAATSG